VLATLQMLLVSVSGSEKMCCQSPAKNTQTVHSKNIARQFVPYVRYNQSTTLKARLLYAVRVCGTFSGGRFEEQYEQFRPVRMLRNQNKDDSGATIGSHAFPIAVQRPGMPC